MDHAKQVIVACVTGCIVIEKPRSKTEAYIETCAKWPLEFRGSSIRRANIPVGHEIRIWQQCGILQHLNRQPRSRLEIAKRGRVKSVWGSGPWSAAILARVSGLQCGGAANQQIDECNAYEPRNTLTEDFMLSMMPTDYNH